MRNEEFRHSLMADKNSSSPSEDQGTFLYIPQVYPKKRQEIYKPVINIIALQDLLQKNKKEEIWRS